MYVVDTCENDPNVKVVVLKGMPKAFSAGGDIGYFYNLIQQGGEVNMDSLISKVGNVTDGLKRMSKLVISSVSGAAAGAGVSLAFSGDFVVCAGYVRQIINLTQTTSGSYLLMSSLDISRRNLAQRGRQIFHQVADMAEYAREEINAIGGYYAFGKELVDGNSVFDFDITKLSVHTLDIGLAGIEVYDILRDEYDIQIEFGDIGNILAYLSIGDRAQEVERLVSALAEIRRRFQTDGSGLLSQEYIDPQVVTSPQEAFYADKCSLPLRETEGKVCSEFVMCYPPGIPIIAPGEVFTEEIVRKIEAYKAAGLLVQGPANPVAGMILTVAESSGF